MKCRSSDVSGAWDIFSLKNWETFINGVHALGDRNEKGLYQHLSNVISIGRLVIRELLHVWKDECVTKQVKYKNNDEK